MDEVSARAFVAAGRALALVEYAVAGTEAMRLRRYADRLPDPHQYGLWPEWVVPGLDYLDRVECSPPQRRLARAAFLEEVEGSLGPPDFYSRGFVKGLPRRRRYSCEPTLESVVLVRLDAAERDVPEVLALPAREYNSLMMTVWGALHRPVTATALGAVVDTGRIVGAFHGLLVIVTGSDCAVYGRTFEGEH